MKKVKQTLPSDSSRRVRPALSIEAKENQMISLAMDMAEQQLRDGTASAQVITHFLKLGSARERLEKEILEKQKELIEVKTQNIQLSQKADELYSEALAAMRAYSGNRGPEDE